jgi:hypothetical protein
MIIGISGKLGSGKDTVGKIIQWLIDQEGQAYIGNTPFGKPTTIKDCVDFLQSNEPLNFPEETNWENKKFADKLKDIVCLLLNCTREQLEDREFKEKELGEEWWYYTKTLFYNEDNVLVPYLGGNKNIANNLKWYIVKLTPRLLLQLLGTECGRQIIHPNIWVNALMSEYKSFLNIKHKLAGENVNENYEPHENDIIDIYPNWIITDMRFPNELKAIKDENGITIRVNRGTKTMVEMSNEHKSEASLDNAEFDYVIDNNGTIEKLIEKVKEILIKEKII